MSGEVIRSIGFGDRGEVIIEYMRVPDDVRHDGRLIATHSLTVMECPDYQSELDALKQAALDLLRDASEDFDNTTPVELPPDEDLDDDPDE